MDEIKTTITTLAGDALLGRVIDAAGAPLDGGATPTNINHMLSTQPSDALTTPKPQMLETGIKAIDFYAPLVRGGIATMVAGAGAGKIVATCEIIHTIATRHSGCAVLAVLEDPTFDRSELLGELRSAGIEEHIVTVLGQASDPVELRQQVVYTGLTLAEYFCKEGREVVLVLDERLMLEETLERLQSRLRFGAGNALTTLVWQHITSDMSRNPVLERLLHDHHSRIVFSRDLGRQGIWPAVDPLASSSYLVEGQIVPTEHFTAVAEARALLHNSAELFHITDKQREEHVNKHVWQVLQFQTQPFFVAEPFTAKPGQYVPIAETVRGFREVLDQSSYSRVQGARGQG